MDLNKFISNVNNYDDLCTFSWWIYLWHRILHNWNNSYFQIKELKNYFQNTQNMQISFSKNQFFSSGKYAWPYSLSNAELIIEKAKYHTNLYDLLLHHPFNGALSLHKTHESLSAINTDYDEDFHLEFEISRSTFANSKLNRKEYFHSLKIANWNYSEVIISAICYCLEDIFIENKEKLPKTIFWEKAEFPEEMQRKSLLFALQSFFYRIFDYLVCFKTSEDLLEVFEKVNIISVHKLQFIKAFQIKFKDIDEWKLIKFNANSKNSNKIALFHIFKAFNLSIIFPDELILNIVTWNIDNNHFRQTRNMLDIYKSFVEKLDLFESISKNSNNFEKNIEKIKKIFILDFFQLQTIDGIGIERQYGDLENSNFIKLGKFFHTLFPSFSLETIYVITQNQYLLLKKKRKWIEIRQNIKQNLSKIKYLIIMPIGGSFFGFPQLRSAAPFPPPIPPSSTLLEAFVAPSSPSNTRYTPYGRPFLPQAQVNSEQQVISQIEEATGQMHLSIGSASDSQRVQLAQKDSKVWLVEVFPRTQSEFFVNEVKGRKYIIIHGAGGNYKEMGKDLADFKKYATSIGAEVLQLDDLVRAHLAPQKLRENCDIRTDVGTSILSSKLWNQIEETGRLKSRNLTYRSGFEGIALEEILLEAHVQTRKAIVGELEKIANVSGEEFFLNNQTIAGHEKMSYVSVKQLCRYQESLDVKPNEGVFVLYVRDCISKSKDLHNNSSSPLQEAMFHTRGDGKQHVNPGIMLNECQRALDLNFMVGMGLSNHISSPLAQRILQTQLLHTHHQGYTEIAQVSQRYKNLEDKQQRGEVKNLPSFNSPSDISSIQPGTQKYLDYQEQNRIACITQTPLDKDEALEKSVTIEAGNFNTSSKHTIRSVGDRPKDEIYLNKFEESQ